MLRAAVAPFEENEWVGIVGTERVIRYADKGLWAGFWNIMGALYLELHNFYTCLYCTQVLQEPALLAGFLNEGFLWRVRGPLSADDNNYLTRALVKRGWSIASLRLTS
ncbi:hypothetical protein AYL99_11807 [Fonsecaea erecta]|uniref:Uncharacterized protein n=1 Tax=Fonsecaea erecta TaxID=1367422 RepID=A0A178Z2U7_9EURO|nr:hypothetical protein AYL99_11807 [Fonsecaea erecta]OAP54047.1 hypothetical protein AYL99_11807 [Fonsecaea erecta]